MYYKNIYLKVYTCINFYILYRCDIKNRVHRLVNWILKATHPRVMQGKLLMFNTCMSTINSAQLKLAISYSCIRANIVCVYYMQTTTSGKTSSEFIWEVGQSITRITPENSSLKYTNHIWTIYVIIYKEC